MTINKILSLTLGTVVILAAGSLAINQHIQAKQYASSVTVANITPSTSQFAANTQVPSKVTTAPTKTTPAKTTMIPVQTTTPPAKAPGTYTLADVALHDNGTSCWSAINGDVYDLTSWINQHPGGGGTILIICGKDGSAAFNNQHGGQRRPANELAGFQIGTLGW